MTELLCTISSGLENFNTELLNSIQLETLQQTLFAELVGLFSVPQPPPPINLIFWKISENHKTDLNTNQKASILNLFLG